MIHHQYTSMSYFASQTERGGCLHCLQVLEAGEILRLEPQLGSLQHLTRLDVIRARLTTRDDKATAAALTALHPLRELRLSGSPGQSKTQLSKHMADALTQLTGLVRLEVSHSPSEQQLSSLCGLTRLTHLTFEPSQLSVLLLDRLDSLCGNRYHHVILEFAPGKVSGWSYLPLMTTVGYEKSGPLLGTELLQQDLQSMLSILVIYTFPRILYVCWQQGRL